MATIRTPDRLHLVPAGMDGVGVLHPYTHVKSTTHFSEPNFSSSTTTSSDSSKEDRSSSSSTLSLSSLSSISPPSSLSINEATTITTGGVPKLVYHHHSAVQHDPSVRLLDEHGYRLRAGVMAFRIMPGGGGVQTAEPGVGGEGSMLRIQQHPHEELANRIVHVALVSSSSRAHTWILPAGGVEEGETPTVGAAREAMEEGGIGGETLSVAWLHDHAKKARTAICAMLVDYVVGEKVEKTLENGDASKSSGDGLTSSSLSSSPSSSTQPTSYADQGKRTRIWVPLPQVESYLCASPSNRAAFRAGFASFASEGDGKRAQELINTTTITTTNNNSPQQQQQQQQQDATFETLVATLSEPSRFLEVFARLRARHGAENSTGSSSSSSPIITDDAEEAEQIEAGSNITTLSKLPTVACHDGDDAEDDICTRSSTATSPSISSGSSSLLSPRPPFLISGTATTVRGWKRGIAASSLRVPHFVVCDDAISAGGSLSTHSRSSSKSTSTLPVFTTATTASDDSNNTNKNNNNNHPPPHHHHHPVSESAGDSVQGRLHSQSDQQCPYCADLEV